MRRPLRLALIGALVTVLFTAAPLGAWAWWSASSARTATLTAATLATPASFRCDTTGTLVKTANLSWTAGTPVDPGASYRVTFVVRNSGGTVTNTNTYPATGTTTATSLAVDGTLLGSLLNNILSLLGLGSTVTVTVQSVHGNWTSGPTGGIKLTGGLLIGISCGSSTPTS